MLSLLMDAVEAELISDGSIAPTASGAGQNIVKYTHCSHCYDKGTGTNCDINGLSMKSKQLSFHTTVFQADLVSVSCLVCLAVGHNFMVLLILTK